MTSDPVCPTLAVSCAVLRESEVLVVRRGNAPALGRWAFPGGRVEPGERLVEALAREVREETGVDPVEPRFVMHHETIEREDGALRWHYVLACFVARAEGARAPVAGDDALETRFVRLSDLASLDPLPSCLRVLETAGVLPSRDTRA